MTSLLVHIGAGRTGTTSIQFSLRDARPHLRDNGVRYFGLMLEYAEAAKGQKWAAEGAPQLYLNTQVPEKVDEQLYRSAMAELERLDREGVACAVWSNEAFLTRSDRIRPVLKRIEAAGVSVTPLCYVRRHDDWARSGYAQFGIKFKSYPGPLRNFADWLSSMDLSYARNIATWQGDFPALEVYNFDALDNPTLHFFDRIGVPDVPLIRANDSPSNALLAAWAVFNGRQDKPVMPQAFRRLANRLTVIQPKGTPVPPIHELLPTKAQLEKVQDSYADDLAAVNTVLEAQGQPKMEYGPVRSKNTTADQWDIDRILITSVLSLQRQVLELEEQVTELRAALDNTTPQDPAPAPTQPTAQDSRSEPKAPAHPAPGIPRRPKT